MKKIMIIGSANIDYILKMNEFPVPGETVEASAFMQAMGGKGANQALAAHKLGGDVIFVTSLGSDSAGKNLLKYYKEQSLKVVPMIAEGTPTGSAMIWVNKNGENCIVINPGANRMFTSELVFKPDIETAIRKVDIVLLQMEIPYETVKTICEVAFKHGKKIILNVAPARSLDRNIIDKIDILVVNEVEAETISGIKVDGENIEIVLDKLLNMGVKNVIMTLGDRGSILKNGNVYKHIPAYSVNTVDTTAAGDTFCGAFAAELARKNNWEDALTFATAASAICVTRMGAQPSIPTESEVRNFLNNNKLYKNN